MTDEKELRRQYLDAKRGDLTSYAGMIGEEFSSTVNRLAQILGTSHELSVGEYKESLLRSCIEKFIPKRYSVGTGFILFSGESPLIACAGDTDSVPENVQEEFIVDILNLKKYSVSDQLDIIVFDDNNFSPIFRDRDFVVVRPESVRAIVEVKGFLKKSSVIETVKKYIDLGRKWKGYKDYAERGGRNKLHTPGFYLLSWDVYVRKNGTPECDGGILRKKIVDTYRKNLTEEELKLRNFPQIKSAYIYNDCCVSECVYCMPGGVSVDGYSTIRGKFIRYDEKGTPFLDRDSTISHLLASIQSDLETPFNPDFSSFDQSITMSIFPHKHYGITDILTGKEVNMRNRIPNNQIQRSRKRHR